MKNNHLLKKIALISSIVLSSGFLMSCSITHHEESAGQYLDSSVITTKVKAKLLADKYVNGLPITVKTYKNIVQLSGFVNSRAQEARAIDLAESVKGVAEVKNSLTVKDR